MYNENIRRLDDLIRKIEISIMEHSSDNSYPKDYMNKLLEYLKLIKKEKGNIPNISATFALNWKNKNITNIEESLNIERTIVEKRGAQRYYYLISLEDYNGRPILISGRPDGVKFMKDENESKSVYNKVEIIEVKSSGILSKIFKNNVKLDDLELQKIIYRQILLIGLREQLIFYQYLFEKTSKYSLINNVKKIDLYGYVALYLEEEYLEQLYKVKNKIINNLEKIESYLSKFGVHISGLSEINRNPINKNKIYYFTIIVKVDYNKKVAMDYLKSLFSILDRIEIARNL
ncbi:MAG: hypothetical protein ACO2OX_04425 [Candidatus Nanopusillus sp.]